MHATLTARLTGSSFGASADLWTTRDGDTGYPMAAGTSPSINDAGDVLFQGRNGNLWIWRAGAPSYGFDSGQPMKAGTSPSIARNPSVALTVPAPAASIAKAKISARHHTAKFTFKATGASGFQCALIERPAGKHTKKPKPHFSRCKSPKTYEHLKPGHYTFLVRALSAGKPGKAASKNFKI